MKLTVFNGSPRLGENNTDVMINKFLEGFTGNQENTFEILKLNKVENIDYAVKKFNESEYIMIAFPLYSYSMPSGVKEFIEYLEPFCGKLTDKKIGFLVQYGFPEAIHARALEKYLEKLSAQLGCFYLGTIIKGRCNNLIYSTEKQNKNTFKGILGIGKVFGETLKFDKKLIDRYSKPEESTFITKIIMKLMIKLINKYYWAAELKKNGVFEQSFARPYEKKNA